MNSIKNFEGQMVVDDYFDNEELDWLSEEELPFDNSTQAVEEDSITVDVDNPFGDLITSDNVEMELKEDVEAMWSDLLRLHPELADGTPGEHCVELRAVSRKANKSGKHSKATQNFHLWKADNESKERFIDWYHKHVENKGCCIYYSVHCFDSVKKVPDKKPYTINAGNQLFTRILVADLDHVSMEENRAFDEAMNRLNIPFQSVQTSLNGYQKRFFLSNQIDDEYAVAKFTKILVNKGFKVDERLRNRGQIARLMGTINNKCYDPKFKIEKQFEVRIDRDTDKLISAEEIFDKINSLPTIKEKYKSQYLKLTNVSTVSKDNFKFSAYYEEDKFIEVYKDIIPECYIELLQRPIKHMLIDSPESFTDAVVMFIIPYFKNTLKLSFEETKSIMDKWAEINSYTETDKYERIYYTEYHKGWGNYPTELQEKYGSINFAVNYKPKTDIIAINTNTINIKPELFKKETYRELSNRALMMYLVFLYEFKAQGKLTWSTSELIEYTGFTAKKISTITKELISDDFIACDTSDKHNGEEYSYTLTKTFVALKTERRLELTFTQVRELISLKDSEAKLFLAMLFIFRLNNSTETYINQEDIAEIIGKDRSSVAKTIKVLVKKRLINVEQTRVGKFVSNKYILLV